MKDSIIFTEVNSKDVLPDSFESMKSIDIPKSRGEFFDKLDSDNINILFNEYTNKKIKVIIKQEFKNTLKIIRHFWKRYI